MGAKKAINVRTIDENIALSGLESTDGFMVFYGYDHAKKETRRYTIYQQASDVAPKGFNLRFDDIWVLKVGPKIFKPEEEYIYSTYTDAYDNIRRAAL